MYPPIRKRIYEARGNGGGLEKNIKRERLKLGRGCKENGGEEEE